MNDFSINNKQSMCHPQPLHHMIHPFGKRPRTASASLEDASCVSSCSSSCSPLLEEETPKKRLDCFEFEDYEAPRKRARTSKVSFAHQEATVLEASSPLDKITPEEAVELWYKRTDIKLNQLEARNHILHGVQLESTRGYERYEMDRVKNKSLALKCIYLVAQQPTLSHEEIAEVARECTACARRQAVLTGTQDFFGAYFDK